MGLKKTGIYPVNRNMIDKEKFDSVTWQKWENHLISLNKCDNTENNAGTSEFVDFELTTPSQVTNSADHENSVSTTATIQEIPSLRNLTLRIFNLSIDQRQNGKYGRSDKKEENTADADSQLTINDKGKENLGNNILGGLKKVNAKMFRLPLNTEKNISSSGNSKCKILTNTVIKPAQNKMNGNYDPVSITLEDLVLSTIARNDVPKKPKKRVGAEILTYSDVLARMKKAKQEQEILKIKRDKKKQKQQEKKKRNEKNGTKTTKLKTKQIQTKVKSASKKAKKWISDSESTGSYTSKDSLEVEEMDTFFDNIIKENENEYDFIEETAKQTEEHITSKINTEKKQDEQENKNRYKEKGKIIKTQEKKQTNVKKNAKLVSDNESLNNELNLDSHHSTFMKPSTSKNQCVSEIPEKPAKGSFVLAKFSSYKGKKVYKYVCLIEEITCDKMVVQGLKSIKNSKTKFGLIKNDVSIIEYHDFIECLPAPKFDDKDMLYIFPKNVDILEM